MLKSKIFFLIFSLSTEVSAATYSISGNIENKFINYTENSSNNLGYYHYFQIEQKNKFGSYLSVVNQLRAKAESIEEDLASKKSINKKAMFDGYLGENYIRYQAPKWVIQAGFQEIVWGESYGFNYADIINPTDNRITFFSDKNQARIPILLLNSKYFFQNSSIQLLMSPEAKYSKTLPIDLFVGDLIPQNSIQVHPEKSQSILKRNEYGLKLSMSSVGLDLSLAYFNYFNRNPYYTIKSASLTNLELNENHNRINSFILSLAKTLNDFIVRTDLVYTQNKIFNYFESQTLKNYQANSKEVLLSIDTPTVNKFTGFLVYALKKQDQFKLNSFVPETENYIISKVTYNLENEKNFEVSYTRELKLNGNSLQGQLNWPISNTTELRAGSEFYFGDTGSNFSKIKKMNSLFIGIKNYFQL